MAATINRSHKLDDQAYRPAYWRVAAEEINYRRFFDINGLVALRMEDDHVFWDAHQMLSELLAEQFDEQDEAVKWMIRHVIEAAHRHGAKVGLCGQAPSDHPEFARFLMECGIDSISVNPDRLVKVVKVMADAEKR